MRCHVHHQPVKLYTWQHQEHSCVTGGHVTRMITLGNIVTLMSEVLETSIQ